MKKNIVKKILVISGLALGIIILIGGLYLFFSASQKPVPSPLVVINYPASGAEIGLGETLAVQSTTRDEFQNIDRVELWSAKDNTLTMIEQNSSLGEDQVITLDQGWQAEELGSYRLIVRSFNESGGYGEASVDLTVVENTGQGTLLESADDTFIPPVGGFGEEEEAAQEGGEEAIQEPPPPDPDIEVENPLQFVNLIFPFIWDTLLPVVDITNVEIEALKFRVEEIYVGVYCYVALEAYPTERIPVDGYFDTDDQIHWDIAEHLSGNNAVTIPLVSDQPLDIHLECKGVKADNQTVTLGQLDATHPPEDWNGQIIQAFGSGGEGFSISYRINPPDSGLEAPQNFAEIQFNQARHFIWSPYEGEADGFRIYRNDVLVASVPSSQFIFPITPWWIEPPCGEEYLYHITAYRGSLESPPSNPLLYQGKVCDLGNDIKDVTAQMICAGAGYRFNVKYAHGYPSGSASLVSRVFSEGKMVPGFKSTQPNIIHGEGTTQILLNYQGQEAVTSDQVAVSMIDNQNQDFYVEIFDMDLDWTPGDPDLFIQSASIDFENRKLNINVGNRGCAPAPPTMLAIFREADGWTGFMDIPQLGARQIQLMTMDIQPEYASRWGGEVNLTVDPFDQVEELNEDDDNDYMIGAARIKEVQFYKIDIHNDHDKYSKGEWELRFKVSRMHNGVWEVPLEGVEFRTWGGGNHNLSRTFHPSLEDDDPLLISIGGWEQDDMSANDIAGSIVVYFSSDGYPNPEVENLITCWYATTYNFEHMGSWKEGGDFALTSSKGDYTLYFRILLER